MFLRDVDDTDLSSSISLEESGSAFSNDDLDIEEWYQVRRSIQEHEKSYTNPKEKGKKPKQKKAVMSGQTRNLSLLIHFFRSRCFRLLIFLLLAGSTLVLASIGIAGFRGSSNTSADSEDEDGVTTGNEIDASSNDAPTAPPVAWLETTSPTTQPTPHPTTSLPTRAPSSAPSKPPVPYWEQLGEDIDGEAAGDRSGLPMALSASGDTVAIGAYFNDGNGKLSGHVRAYRMLPEGGDNQWIQLGSDLDGQGKHEYFGRTVALSADGNVLAAGNALGNVRVYGYNGVGWNQIGEEIVGSMALDMYGNSVNLSADGTVVTAGATAFQYNVESDEWTQRGQVLVDSNNTEEAPVPWSVSLSADGSIIALGSLGSSGSGVVQVYRYEATIDIWTLQGEILANDVFEHKFGFSLDLSGDGKMIAVGSPHQTGGGGFVRVFRNDEDSGSWVRSGRDLNLLDNREGFGQSVALSLDGRTMAVGAAGNSDSYGYVSILRFREDTQSWISAGGDIQGEEVGDFFGRSLGLSSEGSILAVGAFHNDGHGLGAGSVRAFSFID